MTLCRRLTTLVIAAAGGVAAFAQAPSDPQKAAADSLNLRFANGIVAVAEEKIITVADVMREVSPLHAGLQSQVRNEKEYNERVEQLYDSAIQDLIDQIGRAHV